MINPNTLSIADLFGIPVITKNQKPITREELNSLLALGATAYELLKGHSKDLIQLPPEGRSPWIENGNELNFYLVGETSADSDRIILKPGEWKIINYERPTNLVTVEKISPSP